MQIEPEALYPLFDTLFLPVEPVSKKETIFNKEISDKRLTMFFEKTNTLEETEFLNKILSAINIKPDEVHSNYETTFEMLPEMMKEQSGHIIIWGIEYKNYEKYSFNKTNGVSIMLSNSLFNIKNDQSLKTKLWNCLKQEFIK